MNDETRTAVEQATEQFPAASELPEAIDQARAVFGFDGYIDRVREMVSDRSDPERYDRLATIEALGERVNRSVEADSSLSFEWLQHGNRTGGHTCHLSRAFGTWGFDPVMIGMYDDPVADPFASEFGDYEVHSIGEPGVTDAVEFDDGKLMLSEFGDTLTLDWATLDEVFGHDRFVEQLAGATLLGTGYWAETPDLPSILEGIAERWDDVENPPAHVLVDPGDVRKLDDDRLRAGREALSRLDEVTSVVVSANRAETAALADAYAGTADRAFEDDVQAAFDALKPTWFVGHGVEQSVVATAEDRSCVSVPAVDEPELTTSSGDHFNAGLGLGLVTGLSPAAAVVLGNAVAGYFVRTADQPSLTDVRTFVDTYLSKF